MDHSQPASPTHQGVNASRLQLPAGAWASVLDCLCAVFPAIARERWLDRIQRGRVLGPEGTPIAVDTAYRCGLEIRYFREVVDEPRIDVEESVLFADAHLVIADKPHGLPVTPAGGFVTETLLARLIRRLDNPQLVPLHRLDRDTAGLVLFSADPRTRSCYHALFSGRAIEKRYEAIAPALPTLAFPQVRRSRLETGEPFFRMRESAGAANSETWIDVLERGRREWRYALCPLSGRKHQLRVHMAGLGAAISNDPLYPQLREAPIVAAPPLQLLAKSLAFIDPLSGERRRFDSCLALRPPE